MAESGVSAVSNNVNSQIQNENQIRNEPNEFDTVEKGMKSSYLRRLGT